MFVGGTLHITIKPDSERIEMNVFDYGDGIPEDRFQKLGEHSIQTMTKAMGLMHQVNWNDFLLPYGEKGIHNP